MSTAVPDLEAIRTRNSAVIVSVISMTLGVKTLADVDPSLLWKQIMESLADVAVLGAEVNKLRDQLRTIRDLHSPAASGDPTFQGAICTGCSLEGARVAWPCPTWKATEAGR